MEDKTRQRLEEGGKTIHDSTAIYDPVKAALGAVPTIQGVRVMEEEEEVSSCLDFFLSIRLFCFFYYYISCCFEMSCGICEKDRLIYVRVINVSKLEMSSRNSQILTPKNLLPLPLPPPSFVDPTV